MTVLDKQLAGREYICDEYSVADIATWPWAVTHNWSGIDIEGLVNLQAWLERMAERPAVAKGRKHSGAWFQEGYYESRAENYCYLKTKYEGSAENRCGGRNQFPPRLHPTRS